MSKSMLVVLLVALVGAVQATSPHYNYGYDKVCPDARVSCKAGASLRIQIYGPGSCTGKANAFCSAFAYSSGKCFRKETLYHKYKHCRHIDADVDAKCWATAAAQAYTQAFAQVLCNGKYAFGCANSYADAYAVACALAQAVVDMNIDLGHNTAGCQANIAVAIKAIAEAVARSQAYACSHRGVLGKVQDKDFGVAVQKVLAKAFASCWMYCDGNGVSATQVTGGGSGTVVVDKKNSGGDNSDAQTGGVPIDSPAPFAPTADLPSIPQFPSAPDFQIDPRNIDGTTVGSKETGFDKREFMDNGKKVIVDGNADMNGFVKTLP